MEDNKLLALEQWLKTSSNEEVNKLLLKKEEELEKLKLKNSTSLEFEKVNLDELNSIISTIKLFIRNNNPSTDINIEVDEIDKKRESLIKISGDIQSNVYEVNAKEIIETSEMKNIEGDLYFFDFFETKAWLKESSSSKDKSVLKKLILNVFKYKTKQIKEVHDLINIIMSTPEEFKIPEGEEHSIFFLNGTLTPHGFIPKTKDFKLFTLKHEYKHIDHTNVKYQRLSEVLEIIFPQKQIRDFALALYYTCLVPRCYEIAVYNIGLGSNGKSWLMSLLLNIAGEYTGTFKPKKENNFMMADFKNKTFVLNQEGSKFLIEADILKEATSNSKINFVKKGKDNMLIQNYTTLVQNSNYDPKFSDSTKGVARRIKIVPFITNDISQHAKAFSASESSRVLEDPEYQMCFINMMHEAFKKLYNDKINEFKTPAIVERKTKELLKKNTPVFAWLENEEFSPLVDISKKGFKIRKKDLFEKYRLYFSSQNLSETYLSKPANFYEDLLNVFDSNYKTKFLIREFNIKEYSDITLNKTEKRKMVNVPYFEIMPYNIENANFFEREKIKMEEKMLIESEKSEEAFDKKVFDSEHKIDETMVLEVNIENNLNDELMTEEDVLITSTKEAQND